MVWEVSVEKSRLSVFGYLIEADTIQQAIEEAEEFGTVIGAKISETMNN